MPLHQICVTPVDNKPISDVKDGPIKEVATRKESTGCGVVGDGHDRSSSQASNLSSGKDICRICHYESEVLHPLISPCFCNGSLRYVHQSCIQQWIKSSDTKSCELCKFEFIMETKVKPLRSWEKLDMSPMEKRKISCSIAFHIIALTCVVWSLYVLIHRTAEEMNNGNIDWSFWTKIVVVSVGFCGGMLFMYIQCKVYVRLCKKWRAYNRVIYVQNVPDKSPPSANVPPTTSLTVDMPPERRDLLSAKSLFSNGDAKTPRRSRTCSAPNIITDSSGYFSYGSEMSNHDENFNGTERTKSSEMNKSS